MDTEWMGRYRKLVAALIMHSNVVAKGVGEKREIGDGIVLNTQELQTYEYVLEHGGGNSSMIEVSRALGIPPSSFSRIVDKLESLGLIRRCAIAGNKKNLTLSPTDYGAELYSRFDNSRITDLFKAFFRDLEPLRDEDIAIFTAALERFARGLPSAPQSGEEEAIKT